MSKSSIYRKRYNMGNKKAALISSEMKIYSLSDPISNQIRYIGVTSQSLNRRFSRHLVDSKRRKTHRDCWIFGLKQKNLLPIIELIDIVDKDNWQFWERYYISQFKAWGFDLTNLTIGGEGVMGVVPWNKGSKGIIKPNMTSIKKGQRLSPATEIKLKQRLSPATGFKKGTIRWNLNHCWPDSVKEKMSKAKLGKRSKRRKLDDEQVIEIKKLKANHTKKELAKIFNVNVSVIDKVLYSKKLYVL